METTTIPGISGAAISTVDTSFKAQADTAISVVLREIKHSRDLHEVSVCINAITAIRKLQDKQEAHEALAAAKSENNRLRDLMTPPFYPEGGVYG